MVAIGLVRGISAGIVGTEDQIWNSFWVQLEASISVIAACPTAFRSLFLINHPSKNNPDGGNGNQGKRSALERLWRRTKPTLQSIRVGATLTGMDTVIHGSGKTHLDSQDDDGYVLSSTVGQELPSSPSLEALERGMGATQEPVQAIV